MEVTLLVNKTVLKEKSSVLAQISYDHIWVAPNL